MKQERSYNKKSSINNYLNRLQPYEQLIADELEQAQVPDRADAIWAVIEKGLDLDMPTDSGPSQPPSSPAPRAGWGKGLLLLAGGAIVVAITVLFLSRNKTEPSLPNQSPRDIPVVTKPPDDSQGQRFPSPGTQPPVRNGPAIPGPGILTDSGNAITTLPPVVLDSNSNSLPSIIPSVRPDTAATIPAQVQPPPKADRQRGVKGIKDSDYKIVTGKKDSI